MKIIDSDGAGPGERLKVQHSPVVRPTSKPRMLPVSIASRADEDVNASRGVR